MNTGARPPQPVAAEAAAGETGTSALGFARIVYVLYLVSLLLPVTAIVGVIMAYVCHDEAPDWLRTHFRFQIRTFWIGLLFLVAGTITALFLVGYLVLLFALIWFIVRCVKGLMALERHRSVPHPASWMFG